MENITKVYMNNDKARREWLEQYHAWGVWFTVPQTGATWYRAYLPDGTMLAVEEYEKVPHKSGEFSWTSHEQHFYAKAPGEQFEGRIQTEGYLLSKLHDLRGDVEIRYSDEKEPNIG